jgi:hypothetical protein
MRTHGLLRRPSSLLAAVFAALLAALPLASGAEIQIAAPDDRIRTTTIEATLKDKVASVQAYCSVKDARLSIDRNDVGWVPYLGDLAPGSHYLEVTAPGYYPLGSWFIFAEKNLYTIEFAPTRITGFLDIEVEPKDASVLVDGRPTAAGLSELPVGPHRLVLRRFGYTEVNLDVVVAERATKLVALSLEAAPFAIEGLGFSRSAFNPRNAGAVGRASLEFRASNSGSARAEILGPDGASVAVLEYASFEDWSQSRSWDGLGPDGKALPDGIYTARLVATPAPGTPVQSGGLGAKGQIVGDDGVISAEATVRIDSTIVIRAFGTASAMPGLLYMPDPALESAGTIAAEAFWFSPWGSPETSAFGLSAAISLGGVVALALNASAETLPEGSFGSGDLAGSALVSLFGDKTSAWSGAFFLRGGYSPTAAPSLPGAMSAIEASLPLAARIGGSSGPDLRLGLAPGARVDFSSPSTVFLGLARAGLWIEGPSFKAGLSGDLPIGFSGATPAPAWPAVAALEGRLALGSSPFVAAAYATAAFSPLSSPRFGLGLGLGLLF